MNCSDSPEIRIPSCCMAAQFFTKKAEAESFEEGGVHIRKGFVRSDPCFLSIIIRTQGKRIEPLREVFLCLEAQSCQDFEILLMGHRVEAPDTSAVLELIDGLPQDLSNRIAFIEVENGGRSRPLNVALRFVEGDYFVALDDDDLVFDHWVESFVNTARENTGCIVHCGVYTQPWIIEASSSGDYMCSIDRAWPEYCEPFDSLRQYLENRCPIMSLAFPSFLLNDLGMRFDETLSTNEDWDFFTRATQICRVVESGENTAIYRLWQTRGVASRDVHSPEEWEENRLSVLGKLDARPLMLPNGSASRLSELYREVRQCQTLIDAPVQFYPRASYAIVDLSDGTSIKLGVTNIDFDVSTSLNAFKLYLSGKSVAKITIFLRERGLYSLDNPTISLKYESGASETFDLLDLKSNGYVLSDQRLSFLRSWSWFSLDIAPARLDRIEVSFKFVNYINEDLLSGTKLKVRARGVIWKMRHRFRRKTD